MKPCLRCLLLVIPGCLALACGTAACRSAAPPAAQAPAAPPAEGEPQTVIKFLPAATVIHVNGVHRYVIMECTALPSEGEEAIIYRGKSQVALVRIGAQRRQPFVAADILAGEPLPGDLVKLRHEFRVERPEEETP